LVAKELVVAEAAEDAVGPSVGEASAAVVDEMVAAVAGNKSSEP